MRRQRVTRFVGEGARLVRRFAENAAAFDAGLCLQAVGKADHNLLQPPPAIVVRLVRAAVEVRDADTLGDDLRRNRGRQLRAVRLRGISGGQDRNKRKPSNEPLPRVKTGCDRDPAQSICGPLRRSPRTNQQHPACSPGGSSHCRDERVVQPAPELSAGAGAGDSPAARLVEPRDISGAGGLEYGNDE